MSLSQSIYDSVTEQIIQSLEEGVLPWRKNWNGSGSVNSIIPQNILTNRNYTGINTLILMTKELRENYSQSHWATYSQIRSLGGNVRQGEKGTTIIFVAPKVKGKKSEDSDETVIERRSSSIVKRFTVFNFAQCEGLDPIESPSAQITFEEQQNVINSYIRSTGAEIRYGGDQACFYPLLDKIAMPFAKDFSTIEAFFAATLHELIHWTGHTSRLNRISTGQNKESYAKEELVAEIGATFLTARFGLPSMLENHASYINHWLSALKDDHRAIFTAASAAQKAVNYLDSLQSNFQNDLTSPQAISSTNLVHVN